MPRDSHLGFPRHCHTDAFLTFIKGPVDSAAPTNLSPLAPLARARIARADGQSQESWAGHDHRVTYEAADEANAAWLEMPGA